MSMSFLLDLDKQLRDTFGCYVVMETQDVLNKSIEEIEGVLCDLELERLAMQLRMAEMKDGSERDELQEGILELSNSISQLQTQLGELQLVKALTEEPPKELDIRTMDERMDDIFEFTNVEEGDDMVTDNTITNNPGEDAFGFATDNTQTTPTDIQTEVATTTPSYMWGVYMMAVYGVCELITHLLS